MKPVEWFIDHIGNVIYRDSNGCECNTCKSVSVHGITISDRNHAIYLHDIQMCYLDEGIDLNYRDEK